MFSARPTSAAFLLLTLFALVHPAYAQLGPPQQPADNPNTEQKRILGKILFWDEQLSSNDTVACGTCHIPAAGGSDPRLGNHPGPDGVFSTEDDTIGSPGVVARNAQNQKVIDPLFGDGLQVTPRVSPGIYMSMYAGDMFWDGRARTVFEDPQNPGITVVSAGGGLESQAVGPILSSVEMAHDDRNWTQVISKLTGVTPLALAHRLPADVASRLNNAPSYPDLFAAAFGDPTITAARIGMAIATYERTLVPDETPWDRYMRGDQTAMTPAQIAGWQSFEADTVCDNCHTPPQFTDHQFYNIGLRPASDDIGRQNVTLDSNDFGSFKTPSLRNVGLRKALTHVGWVNNLQDAVDFYNANATDTGHRQFTQFQSDAPALNGGVTVPYALVTFFPEDPVGQAPVLDFMDNALTDPRAATESFPFDRPLLDSEKVAVMSYNLAGSGWTAQRADLVAGIVQAADADIVGLQQTTGSMLADLVDRLGDDYSAQAFNGGGVFQPVLLKHGKFAVLESGATSSALSCGGDEFVNYLVLEYITSGERIAFHNSAFCEPGTAYPADEYDGQARNEAMSMLLAETLIDNQATWSAPGIAVGDFNATNISNALGFLLDGDAHTFADSNPASLDDVMAIAGTGPLDPNRTQWILSTKAGTGMNIVRGTEVDHPDVALAADAAPLIMVTAVDTTPINIQALPGDPGDTAAPSTPGGLSASGSSLTSITLAWNAATDDTAVSRYRLHRDGQLLATVTSPGYTDINLRAGITYSYRVTAIDAAGNTSVPAQMSAATQSPAPPPPPPGSSGGGGQLSVTILVFLLIGMVRRAGIRKRNPGRL